VFDRTGTIVLKGSGTDVCSTDIHRDKYAHVGNYTAFLWKRFFEGITIIFWYLVVMKTGFDRLSFYYLSDFDVG
jgi:hypothetical protein